MSREDQCRDLCNEELTYCLNNYVFKPNMSQSQAEYCTDGNAKCGEITCSQKQNDLVTSMSGNQKVQFLQS